MYVLIANMLIAFILCLSLSNESASSRNGIYVYASGIESVVNEGNHYYELGNYEEAIESYDQALVIDPKDVNALNNKELALEDLNKLRCVEQQQENNCDLK